MDYVYELTAKVETRNDVFIESEGLFSTEERAIEIKQYLEKCNPNKKYDIIVRRVF